MPFVVGEMIGQYQLVEQLGQGGMATVFRAYHAALDRYVAIKVLHPALLADPMLIKRFQREAHVVARMDHPNIVPVYDFAEHEGRPYLVMKFIHGQTLKAHLTETRLSLDETLHILETVGSALSYAHQQQILHRDIKPSNVLLSDDGHIYLADFGLARMAVSSTSNSITGDTIVGTPQYISPEQALTKTDLDARTDIYSLGVMLYEMVVGQVPFASDTPFSIIFDHIYKPLPLPRQINPQVPEGIERVLLKSLAKERDDRYQTVDDMLRAFQSALAPASERATPASGRATPASGRAAPPPAVPQYETLIERPPSPSVSAGPTGSAAGPLGSAATPVKSKPVRKHETLHEGRRRLAVAIREPWGLAEDKVKLPGPGPFPQPPAPVNVWMMVLPPVIMVLGMVIVSLVMRQTNLALILPMLIMSMGFPIANVVVQQMAAKKYKQQMVQREQSYRQALDQQQRHVEALIDRQRKEQEKEYPLLKDTVQIAQAQGKNPRLWWRRTSDVDFLSLRLGTSSQAPNLTIEKPQMFDMNDPLVRTAEQFVEAFHEVPDFPSLLPLRTAGSMAVSGKTRALIAGLVRRLLVDVLVHHSPEDVCLAVLSDQPDLSDSWEWLKWAPHTRALATGQEKSGLAFTKDSIDTYLIALKRVYQARKDQNKNYTDSAELARPAYLILVDDSGAVRQSELVSQLAGDGHQYGFYLLFVGEQSTPKSCRARVTINERKEFSYLETWNREGRGLAFSGRAELADLIDCERVSRALAALEVAGGSSAYSLPQSVRISAILKEDPFAREVIEKNWLCVHPDEQQVLFPVGVCVTRNGIEEFDLDFRPEAYGGKGEYHAMLIGTTGSGKSIFLQSLVLATAHRYSPREINFLFMDFKAGAAELKKISDLPHVVGMITDLGPALAERALKALENELERRKMVFDNAGKITDIWDFNRRYPREALPHLMVVIDEFAEGIKILPDLVERLRDLGRQGRAFGLYFLLANQEVNFAVDQLKSNVGWYIVLKVKRVEEMSLIDRSLPISPGKGRGYVRVKNDITEFQGTFSGSPVITSSLEEANEFVIESVGADGSRQVFYRHAPAFEERRDQAPTCTELEMLLERMKETAEGLKLEPARRIYLDPLPPDIHVANLVEDWLGYRRYAAGAWSPICDSARRLVAPIGMLDIPEECRQSVMELDFTRDDGNLWVVGSPGSGKARTLTSIIQSLAYTHRPDEVQFYILEYGAGSLRVLENLPHTAAVIRLSEQERLERLLKFLEQLVETRTNQDHWRESGEPEVFLVINNYAELRATYPDQAEVIQRFVTRGKGAGLHLIIASNRGSELTRSVSSNIARRIVLQMATNDEYQDVIGKSPAPLSARCEGRGYYVAAGYRECQVALPALETSTPIQLGEPFSQMQVCWEGPRPMPISTLPNIIFYSALAPNWAPPAGRAAPLAALLGIGYESLQPLSVNLEEEIPNWLVLGPRQSGKTNFLISFAFSVFQNDPNSCEIKAFALRRGPLQRLASDENSPFQVLTTQDDILQECQALARRPTTGNPKKYLLLIDDLGAAFEPGREMISAALNQLAGQLSAFSDVYLVAACLRDEVQMQLGMPIIRVLRQSRTGVAFSKDASDLDWLGGQVSLAVRKLYFPPGRGLFVNKGMLQLIQAPCMDLLNCMG